MSSFNTKQLLAGSPSLIPTIANNICSAFRAEDYEVTSDALSSGGYDISITKGGKFKAVLGMRTALKITLLPMGNKIQFEAGVGIWGQQAIPTIISMFFFWPVLITQIWGLVQQSKLDDKALGIAKDTIINSLHSVAQSSVTESEKFCIYCGEKNADSAVECKKCHKAI